MRMPAVIAPILKLLILRRWLDDLIRSAIRLALFA
jgi:hypothetical protein